MQKTVKSQKGFTLIELMITVAIIGILTAIAYPSYTKFIVRSSRTAAQGFMFQVANKQQQRMLDARSFASSLAELNLAAPSDIATKYTITTTADMAAAPPTFVVTATPTAAQHDPQCMNLTLTNLGVKGTNGGTATSASSCW